MRWAVNEELQMATMDNPGTVPEVEAQQFAFEAGRINSRPALALVATAALFLVASLLTQFDPSRILVIVAALLSLPILFLYPLMTPRNGAPPQRGFLAMVLFLGGFVPYGLGCYLTFYEGIWGLGRLFRAFAVISLLWSLACCLLGLAIVNGMYRLTEICRAVDEGRIIVRRAE
jgi:hypothetical protein